MKRLSIMDWIASLFSSPHGSDRMKPALAVAVGILAWLPSLSLATTFGPVPLVEQAENTQYAVRGRVVGASWTKLAPRVNRPYTYWRIAVTSQQLGAPLGPELVVRQPGGEVGETGYRMAGTAEFRNGEDVFLFLHDTIEGPEVKEAGLAIAKYSVDTGPDGRKIVVNGLGLAVKDGSGRLMSPEGFTRLLERVARREATEEDRSIFVNKLAMHEAGGDHDPVVEAGVREAERLLRRPAETGRSEAPTAGPGSGTAAERVPPNPLSEPAPAAEEPRTGPSAWGWALAGIAVAGLLAALALFFRR